ncbi:MAG: alpha-amylase, partial [Ornithinimicrobium sp.]
GLPAPGRLPDGQPADRHGREWLLDGGPDPALDRVGGIRRARAATLLMLALPGSAYLYQGEELGLHEVAEITDEQRQDPTFFRSAGIDVGRDGCRVPLPWSDDEPGFGFGAADAQVHLPQPAWFARHAVTAQEDDTESTLQMYRTALRLRRDLQTTEDLAWVETGQADVLHFTRPNGWQVITNFGTQPYPLGDGQVVVGSAPLVAEAVPAESTVWMAPPESADPA